MKRRSLGAGRRKQCGAELELLASWVILAAAGTYAVELLSSNARAGMLGSEVTCTHVEYSRSCRERLVAGAGDGVLEGIGVDKWSEDILTLRIG